jgi:predicted RNA-binding protein with RPS1 domain
MSEQEIRAWTLLIAEVKNGGSFCNVKNCEGGLIELSPRQHSYLKVIERYIADDNYWGVSDDGRRLSGEVS